MGDQVILTGALHQIKNTYPEIILDVERGPGTDGIFAAIPYLSKLDKTQADVEIYPGFPSAQEIADCGGSLTGLSFTQMVHYCLMKKMGLSWSIANVKPDLYVPGGVENPVKVLTPNRYWILAAENSVPFKWYPHYTEVIRALQGRIVFVQVGIDKAASIEGALNLCGTTSIAELLAIFHDASGAIGGPGFSAHIAAGFNIPHVTIAGSIEHPRFCKYSGQIVLYNNGRFACGDKSGNCKRVSTWRPRLPSHPCPGWDGKSTACMRAIRPEAVIAAIEHYNRAEIRPERKG